MARNKVMKLWTAVVSAFLALFTALGFITTTTAAAEVPQTKPARNTAAQVTPPRPAHGHWPRDRSLPPTMKQRIRAEAHGSSPTCRHHLPASAPTLRLARCALRAPSRPAEPPEATVRLQH
ncbi:DUF6344 domain-containing protein [Streptomyces sp. NPDC047079]|uniref:DUF6344 domain-containing protein n=1 Tax=Streptomyces sp. NPDC047079 TaxID=3154607 RepID=UPI0033FF0D96